MPATFRNSTPADRKDWVQLRFELWPDCPRERHLLEVEQLEAGDGVVALAEFDGVIVGFAEVSIRADHVEGTTIAPVPYLEGWYVQASRRGQGVGRGLLAFVEAWALAQGYHELASDAELANTPSITLHRQLGFSEVGRSVHFVKKLKGTSGG